MTTVTHTLLATLVLVHCVKEKVACKISVKPISFESINQGYLLNSTKYESSFGFQKCKKLYFVTVLAVD